MKKKIKRILNELTYFVPDGMLVLAIVSLFYDLGKYDLIVSLSLFVAYLGLLYGERYFHRLSVAQDMVDDIVDSVGDLVEAMQEERKQYVTAKMLYLYADVLEQGMDEKIEALREELKGDALIGEVDKEEQCQDQERCASDREVGEGEKCKES